MTGVALARSRLRWWRERIGLRAVARSVEPTRWSGNDRVGGRELLDLNHALPVLARRHVVRSLRGPEVRLVLGELIAPLARERREHTIPCPIVGAS
jgi:hypothetical protein